MKFLNFGSLNIDKVYDVSHFVNKGETLSSISYSEFAGGKGLNQSIALSRSGSTVFHAGKIGADGLFLKDTLQREGINTDCVFEDSKVSGHAIIQVDSNGENCILLFGGANKEITVNQVDIVLNNFFKGDILVLQNEINLIDYIIDEAHKKELLIALNPSPIDKNIKEIDFSKIDYLIFNEIEGKEITNESEPTKILNVLLSRYNNLKLILTLGSNGVIYKDKSNEYFHDIYKTDVVDTTAAGDTFLGFFLSILSQSNDVELALKMASKASSIAVSRNGASVSIPLLSEIKI